MANTKEQLPTTNADKVIAAQLHRDLDKPEEAVVDFFRLMLARAEQMQGMRIRLSKLGKEATTGGKIPDRADVNAELLDGWFEATCLKWFLAQACKQVATELEQEVVQKQNILSRIRNVTYTEDGTVDAYQLDKELVTTR